MNGKVIRTKEPCDLCGKRTAVASWIGKEYILYVYNKLMICKMCAKKKKVI